MCITRKKTIAVLMLVIVLTVTLCACGGDTVQTEASTETTGIQRDAIYLNFDKIVYGTASSQKDRSTGLYTIRMMVGGQIVELQTENEKVLDTINRVKTVTLEFYENGLIKDARSASTLGGSLYENVTVTGIEGSTVSFSGTPTALTLADNFWVYNLTGLTADYGTEDQLAAGDRISCYVDADGYLVEAYILERHGVHDDSHSCDHCGQNVEWISWDGTQPLTSGHYYLCNHVSLDAPMALSDKEIVLCLNGYTLSGKTRVFELKKGASLTVMDHETVAGEYKGKIVGGGIGGLESDQSVGGTVYIANGASLQVYGGELSSSASSAVSRGGVIYCEGRFALHGGVVTGCEVKYNGGALYLGENSIFEMDGGVMRYGSALKDENVKSSGNGGTIYVSSKAKEVGISGGKLIAGTAVSFGGGLYTELSMVITGGEFTGDLTDGVNAEYGGVFCTSGAVEVAFMDGVVFSGGSATEGGNLACRTKGTVTLHEGVVVRDGYGERNGGNIVVFGTVNIEGATVRDGYTEGAGGNIYCYSNGDTNLNIYSGTITNGSGSRGGNISMYGNVSYEKGSVLNVYGGIISNGEARTYSGGNVDLRMHSVMTMCGGQITGGKAMTYGGGLSATYSDEYQVGPSIYLGGDAVISGNTASDVYLVDRTYLSVLEDTPFTANANIGIEAENPAEPFANNVLTDCAAVFTWTPGDKQILWQNNTLIAQ